MPVQKVHTAFAQLWSQHVDQLAEILVIHCSLAPGMHSIHGQLHVLLHLTGVCDGEAAVGIELSHLHL